MTLKTLNCFLFNIKRCAFLLETFLRNIRLAQLRRHPRLIPEALTLSGLSTNYVALKLRRSCLFNTRTPTHVRARIGYLAFKVPLKWFTSHYGWFYCINVTSALCDTPPTCLSKWKTCNICHYIVSHNSYVCEDVCHVRLKCVPIKASYATDDHE